MAEAGSQPETPKGPTAETFEHLRHQIKDRIPQAERIAAKSGTTPTPRMLNNMAGELLRKDTDAGTDPLTRLLNLKGYEMRQQEELQRAARNQRPMTVVVGDANGLKKLNDTNGHEAGDELLKKIARILQDSSRVSDVVARVGGDEYRILLPETNSQQAEKWLQRTQEALTANGISLSIGMADVDITNIDVSIKLADERMYQAKQKYKEENNSAK